MQSRREFIKIAGMFAVNSRSWLAVAGVQDGIGGPHSLRAHAAERNFLVGCAVVPQRFSVEPLYASTVDDQANILVAENAMKWAALRPAPDRFDFCAADYILSFNPSDPTPSLLALQVELAQGYNARVVALQTTGQ